LFISRKTEIVWQSRKFFYKKNQHFFKLIAGYKDIEEFSLEIETYQFSSISQEFSETKNLFKVSLVFLLGKLQLCSVKERILKTAVDLFWRYGVKSVTMDDIAKELGISKKTIYQQFNDKDAIVKEVVEQELQCEQTDMDRLEAEASDPIEEVMRTSDYMRARFATMSPVLLNDLKKYHPKAWAMVQKHKHEHIIRGISGNLQRGMAAGLYRSDLDVDVLARMRVEQIEMAFDPAIFPPQKFAMIEVHTQLIHHFLRGILTDRGIRVYNNYTEKPVQEVEQS